MTSKTGDKEKGIIVKRKKTGFTLTEMLVTVAIVSILISLLIPSLRVVRRMAKETSQRAQFAAINMGLLAFKDDYGEYPPSDSRLTPDYQGAQRLAEAMVGRDLLGFHPDSDWNATTTTYYPTTITLPGDEDKLKERKDRYVDIDTANAFLLDDLFGTGNTGALEGATYVLCDVFLTKKVTVGTDTFMAGTPILYYRATPGNKKFETSASTNEQIYNAEDNKELLINIGRVADGVLHRFATDGLAYFYDADYKLLDSKVPVPWPHRPDSYILISAGFDGEYGTEDDITNF
jgi:prepilin-type N-terminal cleavage/methylation domain-containing protein